ncbi:hypothetical protein J4421_03105 [Candidatus Woesearchaeota archaeon]|nr:hypothetical protein [Candidatus Woesearchaeota archaeon]
MIDLIPWDECTRKFIRKVEIDYPKITSVIETAKARHEFIQEKMITEKNVSFIFDGYYEVIKELLIALMLKKGLRSQNHQCLFSFFAKEYQYDAELAIIKQMNYLRNRLDYYGEKIELSYFTGNHNTFEKIIRLLLKLLRK